MTKDKKCVKKLELKIVRKLVNKVLINIVETKNKCVKKTLPKEDELENVYDTSCTTTIITTTTQRPEQWCEHINVSGSVGDIYGFNGRYTITRRVVKNSAPRIFPKKCKFLKYFKIVKNF